MTPKIFIEKKKTNIVDYQQDPILKRVIEALIGQYSYNIIAIYCMGSFFDEKLPSEYVKNDIYIIFIVKSFEKIPNQDWTKVQYKKKDIDGHQVWIGFNTIQAYQDRYSYNKPTEFGELFSQ